MAALPHVSAAASPAVERVAARARRPGGYRTAALYVPLQREHIRQYALVAGIERDRFLELLDESSDPIALDCANAIRAGDELTLHGSRSNSAANLAVIYQRRAEHVRRINLDARGLDEAARRFREAEETPLGLAIVAGSEREYIGFFAADGSELLACISIPAKSP